MRGKENPEATLKHSVIAGPATISCWAGEGADPTGTPRDTMRHQGTLRDNLRIGLDLRPGHKEGQTLVSLRFRFLF